MRPDPERASKQTKTAPARLLDLDRSSQTSSSSKTPEVLLFFEHPEEVVDTRPHAIKNTRITMLPDYPGAQNENVSI
jgi:hypothetical protein